MNLKSPRITHQGQLAQTLIDKSNFLVLTSGKEDGKIMIWDKHNGKLNSRIDFEILNKGITLI